jgi:hypothetical protein
LKDYSFSELTVLKLISTLIESTQQTKQTPLPESASEQYQPNDSCLLAKLVPIFADGGHVVSVTVVLLIF